MRDTWVNERGGKEKDDRNRGGEINLCDERRKRRNKKEEGEEKKENNE